MTAIPLQSRFKQDFVRIRKGVGSYINGLWVDGPSVATPCKGSVQPFNDRGSEVVQKLREGVRTKKFIVIYTYVDTLFAHDERMNTPADIVWYENEAYEVQKVNRWKGQILTHDEVWAWELDPGDTFPGQMTEWLPTGYTYSPNDLYLTGFGTYLTTTESPITGFTVTVNGDEKDITSVAIEHNWQSAGVFIGIDYTIVYGDNVVVNYTDAEGTLVSTVYGHPGDFSVFIDNTIEQPE